MASKLFISVYVKKTHATRKTEFVWGGQEVGIGVNGSSFALFP